MAVYFDSTGRIVSASTGISAERIVDILVRMVAVADAVFLVWLAILLVWPRVPKPACLLTLSAFCTGLVLSCADWMPTTDIRHATFLIDVAKLGRTMVGWAIIITAVCFLYALFTRARQALRSRS